MRRLMAVFSIAFVALLMVVAVPMVASAEKVDVEGKGTLWAKGTGRAQVEGNLNFHGRGRAGVLVVEDKAGDAKIDVGGYGRRIDEGNGKVRYIGFNGRAHIEGSQVAVDLQGRDIELLVRGEGKATLKGKGVYRVNGGSPRPWSQSGTTLDFAESAADTADAN